METIEKQQELETIINAIRLTEQHYPEKVVIEIEDEDTLKVYSPTISIFNNCDIISVVKAMGASCYIRYDENLAKVVLIIF